MKTFTRIVGVIAMVAILALAVSCSKNEGTSETNSGSTETATAAAKSDDGLAGTVWQDEDWNKFTFAETGSKFVYQGQNGNEQGTYTLSGDALVITYPSGTTRELVFDGFTLTSKTTGNIYTKQ